jgi:hypothetical protein
MYIQKKKYTSQNSHINDRREQRFPYQSNPATCAADLVFPEHKRRKNDTDG